MRKAVVFISTGLLIIGTLRLIASASVSQFMALDPAVAWLAIGVAGLAYANGSRWLSLLDLRLIFRALGLTLLITTAYSINSPTFGDIRQTYVPVADLFIGLGKWHRHALAGGREVRRGPVATGLPQPDRDLPLSSAGRSLGTGPDPSFAPQNRLIKSIWPSGPVRPGAPFLPVSVTINSYALVN